MKKSPAPPANSIDIPTRNSVADHSLDDDADWRGEDLAATDIHAPPYVDRYGTARNPFDDCDRDSIHHPPISSIFGHGCALG